MDGPAPQDSLGTWHARFAQFHKDWGEATLRPGYRKEVWLARFELLELEAFCAGYRPKRDPPADTSDVPPSKVDASRRTP